MADINFDCPLCQQNLDAPEDMTGMEIECPACGKKVRIPAPFRVHYPIKKPLTPQPAAGPKVFVSKSAPAADEPLKPLEEDPDDMNVKTTKIEIPPDLVIPEPPKHRIITIKRPSQ